MATNDAREKAKALVSPLRKGLKGSEAKVRRKGAVVTVTAGKLPMVDDAFALFADECKAGGCQNEKPCPSRTCRRGPAKGDGLAMVKALCDAITGGDGTVEVAVPCGKHDAATGSGIGWQSWCPGCDPTLHREGEGPAVDSKASIAVRHALLTVRDGIASLIDGSVMANRRMALDDAGQLVQRHLDNATGADPGPAIDAAICRLVAVAARGGVREDEVLRFLEALELDVDLGVNRLAALVVSGVLTWHEQKGKPDAPLVYRRGPAFAKGGER